MYVKFLIRCILSSDEFFREKKKTTKAPRVWDINSRLEPPFPEAQTSENSTGGIYQPERSLYWYPSAEEGQEPITSHGLLGGSKAAGTETLPKSR